MPEQDERILYKKPADFIPEKTFPAGHKKAGSSRCTAWSSRHNRQCGNSPMLGKTKCAYHGGKSPSGLASPNFKSGRHSKVLPARLAANYQASLEDGELLSLRSEIALIDARTQELIGKIDIGEAGKLWLDLKDSLSLFDSLQRQASSMPDGDDRKRDLLRASAETLNDIRNSIRRGAADWMIWKEIKDNLEDRRRLVESEQKRLIAMQTMVTAEQAMILVAALTASVRKYVTDNKLLGKIQNEFVRLTNSGNSESLIP